MTNFGKELAKAGLSIKAIKLNPEQPFLWASGYQMPIYNDNRMFLFFSEYRQLIIDGLKQLILDQKIPCEVIAGTAMAGIPHGAGLANSLQLPFIYIRDKAKDHGLRNQIEGLDADQDLAGKNVVVIEDLISTGGSSIKAVQAVRDANGKANYCLSIFNYGLDEAMIQFNALTPKCEVGSLLTYDTLLATAKEIGYLTSQQVQLLTEWRLDPFGWGEKHGFPKKEKH